MARRRETERTPMEILKGEIEIPVSVQQKADRAFAQIHKMERQGMKKKRGIFPKKRMAVLTIAAVLALGSLTVLAAYVHWSESLERGLRITETQKAELEETQAAVFARQSCTDNGITVTAVQSITDNYFTHLVFKVEGFSLEEGEQPDFETIDVKIDGKDDFSWGGSCYNGLVQGPDGKAMFDDGTPIDYERLEETGENLPEQYVREDGSIEYWLTANSPSKGAFLNKPIHVEIQNLGTVDKALYENKLDGCWTFDWNLSGSGEQKEFELNAPLGDTGAVVKKAELSPISMHVEYDFPMRKETVKEMVAVEAEAEAQGLESELVEREVERAVEPPMIQGVKLKDGTIYPFLTDGGSSGWEADNTDIYTATFANDRVIDVDQVQSLLFHKSSPAAGEVYTEENFYVVDL